MKKNTLFIVVSLISCCVGINSSQADSVRQIASELKVTARGCHSESQSFVVEIPDADFLNTQYPGALAGIEVRHWGHGINPSYSNLQFSNDGDSLSITLHARGRGNWVRNPWNRGGVCVGASGGLSGVNIFAHYR